LVVWKNIGWIRGFAIALVVLNHATMMSIRLAGGTGHQWAWWELLVLFAGRCLAPVCVPLFLFASGYFMGRFVASWRTAASTARTAAVRYAIWSAAMYCGRWWFGDDLSWGEVIFGFLVTGRAQPAYWFVVVLVQLTLLTPWLVNLAATHPGRGLTLAACCLVLAIVDQYVYLAGHGLLPNGTYFLFEAPYFIVGIVFSKRSEQAIALFQRHRNLLGQAAIVAAALNILEVVALGHLLGDGSPRSWAWEANDRLFVHVFVLAALPCLLLSPNRETRLRSWLDWIGMRSLAVVYLFDAVMRGTLTVLWHWERWLGITGRPPSEPPPWIGSAAVALPFTLVSLTVPLLVVVLADRFLGKKLRTTLLG